MKPWVVIGGIGGRWSAKEGPDTLGGSAAIECDDATAGGVSREGAHRKEFEAALRVIDPLRGAWDDGGSGHALLRRLLGGNPAEPSGKASKPRQDAVAVVVASRRSRIAGARAAARAGDRDHPYRGRDQVGVVGVSQEGQKRVVLFQEGSTADPVAMDNLCRTLEARALMPRLCVTDGGLALDREVSDSFPTFLIAHADPYVERAVLFCLADGPAQEVKARLRAALDKTGDEAKAALTALLADLRMHAPARTRP